MKSKEQVEARILGLINELSGKKHPVQKAKLSFAIDALNWVLQDE